MSESPKMVGVRYIGGVARKTDRVGGTKTIWNGPGDVQRVPESVAAKLFRMPGSFVPEDANYKLPERRSPDAECMIVGRLVTAGNVAQLKEQYPEAFDRLLKAALEVDKGATAKADGSAGLANRGPGRPRKQPEPQSAA